MGRYVTLAAMTLTLVGVIAIAPAQQASAPNAKEPPQDVDEIVVTRQRLSSMRREIERAQEDLYKLFNANVSDHQLDMHCHLEMPTGSRLSRRVCRPQFVDNATTQGAWDLMSYLYSQCQAPPCPVAALPLEMGAAVAQEPLNKLRYMSQRLNDEMTRLVRENPDVAKAFANYQSKERAYHEALGGQPKR